VTSEAQVPHITYEQPEADWQTANAFQKSTFETTFRGTEKGQKNAF
jgi:hypothetical protein